MRGESIVINGDERELGGYFARPEEDGRWPAVVVIHEIQGLNDNIRGICHNLAGLGYAALAVDLFHGRNRAVCMARFMGGMLFNSLDHGGIRDLRRGLDYLAALPEVDEERLGAIGFCMGGTFAIAWAAGDARLKVIAPYYSVNPRPLEAVARSCPIVGSFPGKDFTAGAAGKLQAALETYQIPHDIKIYEGAGHSFFNDQGSSYDSAAAEDAWRRTLVFFKEFLGGQSG